MAKEGLDTTLLQYGSLRAKANNLPEPFASHLMQHYHNILYIGIATSSLCQRIGQELWAEGEEYVSIKLEE